MQMHEIRELAVFQKKLQTSLNASVEKAKLSGLYKDQEADLTKHRQTIQSLTINVQSSDEEGKVIDMTPDIEEIDSE
jgi:hypothetical protein